MVRNILLALAFIGLVVTGIVYVAYRTHGDESSPASPTDHRSDTDPASGPASQAHADQIARQSHALMPPGYDALSLTMPYDELHRARPRIQRDPTPRPDGIEVYEEDDPNGTRVIYLIAPDTHRLQQVQFASRIDDVNQLPTQLQVMNGRYGSPTGVWDCPETEEASPVRRFTWRHEGSSVMEAVLIVGQRAAVTVVIASNEAIASALERSSCQPVRSREQLERFPVANEPRGERHEFIREITHDR